MNQVVTEEALAAELMSGYDTYPEAQGLSMVAGEGYEHTAITTYVTITISVSTITLDC